jgi:hypothetical protein
LFFEDAPHFHNTFSANCKLLLPTGLLASSKIKFYKKECEISMSDEKHFFFLIGFFIHPSKFHTLSQDDYFPNQHPILLSKSDYTRTIIWKFQNKKNKKKETKISFRYSVKQVQALRVFDKISTCSGSILSKKPVFLKPST